MQGKLRAGLDALDALVAGFPAGTLTGAPKVRAMEIIEELEPTRRGIYAGCIGYFAANGTMDTCIGLRTAVVKDGTMYVQAGGGVVADSDARGRVRGDAAEGARAVPRGRGGGALRRAEGLKRTVREDALAIPSERLPARRPRHLGAGRPGAEPRDGLPAELDVLIVGCGPAGLTLAAQLAAFPDIRTRIVEQKPGRLLRGQADGIACRTMEMFEAFGFSERVLKEGYWVNETSFWKPDEADRAKIVRSGRIQDTEDGLSEFPHVILNQARVHDFYLDVMRNAPARLEPDYARRLLDLADRPTARHASHPVTVRLERHRSRARRRGGNRAGALRRRLRRRAQRGAPLARPGARGRFGQPGLGRDGRACRHRLPRHPPEVGDPVGA